MENTPAFHPLDYVSVVRRRMWWLIVPAVLAAVVGAALVRGCRASTPAARRSVSRCRRCRPNCSAAPSVSARRSASAAITQGLKNPGLLERIVKEEGLDRNTPTNDAINALDRRTTIAIPPANPNLPPGTITSSSTVQYRDTTPEKTQRIANRLAELFVEDSSIAARDARRGHVGVRRHAAEARARRASTSSRAGCAPPRRASWVRCRSRPTPTSRW